MSNSTTDTYTLKREILSFSNKCSLDCTKSQKKFIADMTYGILASGSCLLSDISDALHESIKKKNTIERLANNLSSGAPKPLLSNYLNLVKTTFSPDSIVFIDDTDIVKPDGYKFEALGIVRDGSAKKNTYSKGYHVTEACTITKDRHPVSLYSHVHSSAQKGYTSANDITFNAINQSVSVLGKATFVMDRGYDDNKMFLKFDELEQDYVIRLTAKRKLLHHRKWIPAPQLCHRRKGKIRLDLHYKGKDHTAYLSHVKVQITASRKDIYLVLVYGITETPMMLATNKPINSKEDVIRIAKSYFSRWRIEEYFRSKKQLFQFENFRVRNLTSINTLNLLITICMAFLAQISNKRESSQLKKRILETANPLKLKVGFHYYRIAKGINGILAYAREGIRWWFKTERPRYRQLCLKL